ncbi:MAG: cobaltochelatase subunit CobT, partial [Rhizobiaceae bacterium]
MAGPGDNSRAKPGQAVDLEPFRRALTGCIRSMAESAEVEVTFANDRPGMAGDRMRLPELSRKPTAQELSVMRGLGDSMALRRACHDERLHTQFAPQGPDARAIYDAVEQARVEAIGASRMAGTAQNLNSMLTEKYAKANFRGINAREDSPIEEAMSLLVREALTGEKPPESAGKVLDLWRSFFKEKADREVGNLKNVMEDQEAFARLVRTMLASMELAEDIGDDSSDSQDEDSSSEEEQPRSQE